MWRLATLPLYLSLLLVAQPLGARGSGAPDDWEPVPLEQLALTRSSIEPGAGAEVLFWKVWVGGSIAVWTREHYLRIKIYSDAGAQALSVVTIDHPLGSGTVDGIRARIIQPDGSAFEMERRSYVPEVVRQRGHEGVRRISFAPPRLSRGSILEYRYSEFLSGRAHRPLVLQRDIPVRELVLTVRELMLTVREPVLTVRDRELMLTVRGARMRCVLMNAAETQADSSGRVTLRDVPSFTPEPFGPPDQQQHWLLEYFQEPPRSRGPYWRALGSDVAEAVRVYTRPDKEVLTLAYEIAGQARTAEARVQRLVDWVQSEFRIADADSLRPRFFHATRDLKDALRTRRGTAEEATLLFIAMARALKFETRLLLAPSLREWFFDAQRMEDALFLPNLQVAVRMLGDWYNYCPAARYLPWDMVPWEEESQSVLLCDPDSSRFLQVPSSPPARSRVIQTGTLAVSGDGTVEGDLTLRFTGHWNEHLRGALEAAGYTEADSTFLDEMRWTLPGFEVSRVTFHAGADRREPLKVDCHVRAPGFGTVTRSGMLFEPSLFHARAPVLFTATERRTPVFFRFAWTEHDSLTLRLPDGWRADSLVTPAPFEALGAAGYACDLQPTRDGRGLVYTRTLHVGDGGALFFPTEHYGALKRFFESVRQSDGVMVTLVPQGVKP